MEQYMHIYLNKISSLLQLVHANVSMFGFVSILVFLSLLWILVRRNNQSKAVKVKVARLNKRDISAISGDDEMTTQLDLARAFMEMKKADMARPILETVIKRGSALQRREAKQLIVDL